MRRALAVTLAAGLLFAAIAAPATAAKAKKFEHTLYMHGASEIGETELFDRWLSDMWHPLDAEEPGSGPPKSQFVTNYLVGPNTECSGNGLLPTWRGEFSGTVKGDVTVKLHTIAPPAAQLSIELYPDGAGGCNSTATGAADYVPPAAEEIVDVPPGLGVTEVTFENVKFKALANLVFMVHVAGGPTPMQVRLLYDSADFASSIELTCVKKPCV